MSTVAIEPKTIQNALPVCLPPWRENPYRLVSLWNMLSVAIDKVCGKLIYFSTLAPALSQGGLAPVEAVLDQSARQELVGQLTAFSKHCNDAGFSDCSRWADRLATVITNENRVAPLTCVSVFEKLMALAASFKDTCETQLFFCVPSAKRHYYENSDIFGPEFTKAFSAEAISEANEAGKCFALARWTACVFHLMRSAEYCLRYIAKRLKVSLTHKGSSHPVEFADWDKIITACKNEIAKARTLPPGTKRQGILELYSDAADHCLFMKDIWRNNISHTRKPYIEAEALSVFERVRDFARFCATMKKF